MDRTIISNDDDTVTLTRGTLVVHFRGQDWREANQAAQILAKTLDAQDAVTKLMSDVATLSHTLLKAQNAMLPVQQYVDQVAAYAESLGLTPTDQEAWGLWWRGDENGLGAGWVEDCGDLGPVTRDVCEQFLQITTSPLTDYRIVRWSRDPPRDTLPAGV
jgi:hypothetical protein